jgi:acyl-CoA thioester hydrolase
MTDQQFRTICSTIERTVEWIDTDAAGHQHNSAILRWVESCEAQLLRELNLPEYFPVAPRARHEVNYRSKLWFGQPVSITVGVDHVGSSSLRFAFEVVGHQLGDIPGGLAADGTFITVHVPLGAEGSAPWPDKIRSALTGTVTA